MRAVLTRRVGGEQEPLVVLWGLQPIGTLGIGTPVVIPEVDLCPPYGLAVTDPARLLAVTDPARTLSVTDPNRTLEVGC